MNHTEKIRMPELQINGVFGKLIKWISHVPHIYWLIIITVFLAAFVILMPHHKFIDFWLNLKSQKSLVGIVLISSLVALFLVWSLGQCVDICIFMYFNMRGHRAPWLDWVMLGLTQVGSGVSAMIIALILLLRRRNLLAYELVFGTLTLWLIVETIKVIVRRKRPYIKLKNIRIVGSRASGHSFPSGHTGQMFFMATLLSHYYNADIHVIIGLYAISLLVGITRIYVGMHYPRDVLGGAVFGTAWGILGIIANS
jgi:membrane-associated phospholipid phosphatase